MSASESFDRGTHLFFCGFFPFFPSSLAAAQSINRQWLTLIQPHTRSRESCAYFFVGTFKTGRIYAGTGKASGKAHLPRFCNFIRLGREGGTLPSNSAAWHTGEGGPRCPFAYHWIFFYVNCIHLFLTKLGRERGIHLLSDIKLTLEDGSEYSHCFCVSCQDKRPAQDETCTGETDTV